MFALLLALAARTVSLPPQVSVPFPGSAPSPVLGPEASGEVRWSHQQTLYAPGKTAAAVRFCRGDGGPGRCVVWLIRPGQPHHRLEKSDVTRLLWTVDGQFLIGAGRNTVRLWNLVGRSRTAVPRPAAAQLHVQAAPVISRLWFSGKDLCVATMDDLSPEKTLTRSRSVTSTRYALPTLRPLTVTTLGVAPWDKAKEAECRPFTSSDLWP